jgi:hypothetical protein
VPCDLWFYSVTVDHRARAFESHGHSFRIDGSVRDVLSEAPGIAQTNARVAIPLQNFQKTRLRSLTEGNTTNLGQFACPPVTFVRQLKRPSTIDFAAMNSSGVPAFRSQVGTWALLPFIRAMFF